MKHRLPICLWATILVLGIVAPVNGQRVIYVDTDAVGANDGSSWLNAFVFLQDGLAATQEGDEVWVAEGLYQPDRGVGIVAGDRMIAFELNQAITIIGGFAGTEATSADRDIHRHTVLTGDLLNDDSGEVTAQNSSRRDNSLNVVRVTDSEVRLDGLTIAGGNADGVGFPYSSGGCLSVVSSTMALLQVTIERCSSVTVGGGMFLSHARLNAERLILDANRAHNYGGGAYAFGSHVDVRHGSVSNNSTASLNGGGIMIWEGDAILAGLDFVANTGNGLLGRQSRIVVANSRFLGNYSWSGGGVDLWEGDEYLFMNTVFSGNRAATYGGALRVGEGSTVEIVNATFAQNLGPQGGSSVFVGLQSSTLSIANSIIGIENDPASQVWTAEGATVTIGSSLIIGGVPEDVVDVGGNGSDPPAIFHGTGPDGIPGTIDDDLHPDPTSPAIESGIDNVLPPDSIDVDKDGDRSEAFPFDAAWAPRQWDGRLNQFGGIVDMGAYEFIGSSTNTVPPYPAERSAPIQVFPNPTSGILDVTGIPWDRSDVEVHVYDLLGKVRIRISSTGITPGSTEGVTIDVSALPPGTYILCFVSPKTRDSEPVATFIKL